MKSSKSKLLCLLLSVSVLLTSCASRYEAIGNVSMLTDRLIKPDMVYEQLTTNSGRHKKELRNSKSGTIEDAVRKVIEKVSGGRFITNVTIYVINDSQYAVSGNVWGVTGDSLPHASPFVLIDNYSPSQPIYPKGSK